MILSFYTERTPFYREAAVEMRLDCQRFGLTYDIQPAKELKTSHPDSKAARQFVQQQKPRFIAERLKFHNLPVWWLDVDCHVIAAPPPIDGWFAAHPQPHKPQYVIMSQVLYFTPIRASYKFLEEWHQRLMGGMSDHTPLVKVFNRWQRHRPDGMVLSPFHRWVSYNGFNSEAHQHPVHGANVTSKH